MPDTPLLTFEDALSHPLWQQQEDLEKGMQRLGEERHQRLEQKARERRQMDRLTPVRKLMKDWLPKMVQGHKDWLASVSRGRGPKPIALPLLKMVEGEAACMICLKAVLSGISIEQQRVTTIAMWIGTDIEHEAKIRMWLEDKEHRKLFWSEQKRMDNNSATDTHRKAVNIFTVNTLIKEGKLPSWRKWTMEEKARVGITMVETLVRVTQWFQFADDPFQEWSKGSAFKSPAKLLIIKPGLEKWLLEQLRAEGLSSAQLKPTVIPPRRWEGMQGGGYWTPYARSPDLVRFKAHQEDQREWAAMEYDALYMPDEYDALHFLQETPWRVNKRVLAVARSVRLIGSDIKGVPTFDPMPFPPKLTVRNPETGREEFPSDEAKKAWKQEAAGVYRHNITKGAKLRACDDIMAVAEEYVDYERIYFPHHMDFRARKYPTPGLLNPQGNDLSRGLLEFADGYPVENDEHAKWLYFQVANFMGQDKLPRDEKLAWAKAREQQWLDIAADPIGHIPVWKEADKPWQALAAIFDLAGLLEHGFGYRTNACQWVDGTCNGIQHLSAMTRDAIAGAYVNLTPGDRPQDIYKYVARLLHTKLLQIKAGGGLPAEYADYWLGLTGDEGLPRSLTKRPVMVLPYGATKEAYRKYIKEWLDENHPAPQKMSKEEFTLRWHRVWFMTQTMWDVVEDAIPGAKMIMEWFQRCAKITSVANQPIYWKVASGFMVRHFYGKTEQVALKVHLDGSVTRLSLQQYTNTLDAQAQLRGIAPNFVHSQDAATLTKTINC